MIRVLLVDDHILMRSALRVVLEQTELIYVVGEADNGESALQMASTLAPDVVVMDVSLPGMSGIQATQTLHARQPEIGILALSTHLDAHIVGQMLEAGASGYIAKSAAGDELLTGIESVFAGRTFLSTQVAALLADKLRSADSQSTGNAPLSRRERQITLLLAQGISAAQIAVDLYISPSTVDVHRRNLMRKLGLHSAIELTRYAIRNGLISA